MRFSQSGLENSEHVWQQAKTIRRSRAGFWQNNDTELTSFGVVRSTEWGYVRALSGDSPRLPLG